MNTAPINSSRRLARILGGVLVLSLGTSVLSGAAATRKEANASRPDVPSKKQKATPTPSKETATASGAAASETENLAAEVPPIPRSVFEMPASPKDGHDPFYPDSTRLFANKETRTSTSNAPTVAVQFALKGLAGQANARFATILPVGGGMPARAIDLAEGDEAQVVTPKGRMKVRCVEIKDESVVIEVAGVQRELRMRAGF
jgi:hypothetical protein